ncbi:MAG TPA: hypothetical protein HPQ00_14765, partial [Magnetococcales bacterium]|nr:hypothetical protein [Magnetococcales bacterium]
LGEEARAVIDKFIFSPATREGGFEATVTKGIFSFESGAISSLNAGRHSTIKTPTAVVGIRGSQLSGEVTADGSTTVVHSAGILDISDARGQGTVTLVEPGSATQVVFGVGAPEPVFKAPASFISRLESQLDIQKVKEEQKKEDSGNKPEQKPEGKKETIQEEGGPKESKNEGAPGEKTGETKTESQTEAIDDAEETIADPDVTTEQVESASVSETTVAKNAEEGVRVPSSSGMDDVGKMGSNSDGVSSGAMEVMDPLTAGMDLGVGSLADLIGTGGAMEGALVEVGAVGETLGPAPVSVSAPPQITLVSQGISGVDPVPTPDLPTEKILDTATEVKKPLAPDSPSPDEPAGEPELNLEDLSGGSEFAATPDLEALSALVESAPAQPAPVETAPTQPAPVEPAPTQPVTTNPTVTESVFTELFPTMETSSEPPPEMVPTDVLPPPEPVVSPIEPLVSLTPPVADRSVSTTLTVPGGGSSQGQIFTERPSIAYINAPPTGSVIITGELIQGQTLTVSNTLADVGGLGMIHYHWWGNDIQISDATG